MLTFEIKKMMRIGRVALPLYFILSFVMLIFTDVPQHRDMEFYKHAYLQALEPMRGALSDEKEGLLEAKASESGYERSEQRGFETLYEQYLYVHENPANRFFLYSNGWAALLTGSVLNVPLVALILLLVTPVLCGEYVCGMESITLAAKRGRDNTILKLLLIFVTVTLVCAADTVMRFAFCAVKYGLPDGGYPLQSLSAFGTSVKTLTLTDGFLLLNTLRWFGALYLTAVILLLSVLTKKTAPTVFLSAAAVILPYMGMSASGWYGIPMPLSFLLGTGFLEGSVYTTDYRTGEAIPAFWEVGFPKLALLTTISALVCAVFIFVLLRKHRNIWGGGKMPRIHGISCLLVMCVLLTVTLCGCSKTDEPAKVPMSTSNSYETDEMRCYIDYVKNMVFMEDKATGEVTELLRSPLLGLSETNVLSVLYGDGKKVYCMLHTLESYSGRLTEAAGTVERVCVVEIDTVSFDERVIFERDISETRMVLGLEVPGNDEWRFLTIVKGVGVDDDYLYFLSKDVYKVSRGVGTARAIENNN